MHMQYQFTAWKWNENIFTCSKRDDSITTSKILIKQNNPPKEKKNTPQKRKYIIFLFSAFTLNPIKDPYFRWSYELKGEDTSSVT